MRGMADPPRTPTTTVALTLGAMLVAGGCASVDRWARSDWAADFNKAEAWAAQSDRPLLILLRDADDTANATILEALNDPRVRERTGDAVKCTLFAANEPDRRYAAQHGVVRGPALILVHADGTYHAHTGSMNADRVLRFLDDAVPPGRRPERDPYIARNAALTWHRTLDSARAEAERTDRPMAILFVRTFSSDWLRLRPLLGRFEVRRRLGHMARCRLESMYPSAKAAGAAFGVSRWPALVIARPGGSYDVLELPVPAADIARFADRASASAAEPASTSARTSASR